MELGKVQVLIVKCLSKISAKYLNIKYKTQKPSQEIKKKKSNTIYYISSDVTLQSSIITYQIILINFKFS